MNRTFFIEESGLPDLSQLMLATINALRALGGSAAIDELNDAITEREGVTEVEQSYLMPNGRDQRLAYYLAWARTFLKRGGALENSARGVWSLTEAGYAITDKVQTIAIYNKVNEEERERAKIRRQKQRSSSQEAVVSSDINSDEFNDDTVATSDWKQNLIECLLQIAPSAFERLAQRLLREAGFVKVEVRGKSGDGGIDGVGVLRVNLVSFQIYFQCKRWQGSVGAREIRDFRGALQGRADKGLFITTGTFTSQASDEATRDGAIAIDLIDGDRLCDLLKQFELGVQTTLVETVKVNSDWFGSI
ncbi:restriction endonuclease [Pseudorhizobium endolithicum]|uniref:Restriction endonuclease n=1 Tax=Pseudorhizobium endolithicum TaxID=1191678 RepID=A0ABM8PT76_9HYPH|nr:restriction endonuclease [Pseudorhizobium endolithicum]CAD7046986.1 restriction endonuclease [Pseudorhizobium endolithicum]